MSKKKTSTIKKVKSSSKELSYTRLAIVLAAALVLELLIANFSSLAVILGGAEKKEIDMISQFGSASVDVSDDEPAVIKDVDIPLKNIRLTLESGSFKYVNVTAAFTDDNFRLDGGYDYNKAKKLMGAGDECVNCMALSSYGSVGSVKLTADKNVKITAIAFNAPAPFAFSMVRFLLIAAAIGGVMFGLLDKRYDPNKPLAVRVCALVMCLMVIFTAAVINAECGEPMLDTIPSTADKQDQYSQLFEAILDGHVSLDIDYDTELLDSLNNPYDRSERNENNLHGAFWDRAYYDGNFYCYFGAAPIFTVCFPVKLLTGKQPTALLMSAFLCLYCVIFISLLYELFLRRFCKDVPLVLAVLGLPALLFGSVIFAVAVEAQFYFIAVLSGIASTAAFLYFVFAAYFSKELCKRVVLLALAGVSVVLIAASRPTLLLYCFVAIVPALDIFTDKKEALKSKLIYTAAIGVPVVIGAVLIMVYNYVRFDNPLEFGFNYQMTVSIAKANTIKLSMIPAALYHYFFQQPAVKSSFPYIRIESGAFDSYTRYNYAGRTMGIFTYPAAWGVFLLPFTLTKAEKLKRRVLLSLTGAAVLMAFIDMCKAGSHYRYTTDIAFIMLLVGLTAIFDLAARLKNTTPYTYKAFICLAAAVLFITIIIGGLFVFANEAETMICNYPEATRFLLKL